MYARPPRSRACGRDSSLAAALKPAGFCWEDANDDKTNDWIPQGLTGSGDAAPATGTAGGSVVAASWHTPGDTMVRLSFVDASGLGYRHVLLVEPTSDANFAVVAGHGHGMTWSTAPVAGACCAGRSTRPPGAW